jgi:hypothetical protein
VERSATRVKSATFIAPHSASLHAGYGFSHRIDLMSRDLLDPRRDHVPDLFQIVARPDVNSERNPWGE